MARTTLDLDATVLAELKARGAQERRSLGAVASDLLAAALKSTDAGTPAMASDWGWRVSDLGKPLVDVEDREALRRALDER